MSERVAKKQHRRLPRQQKRHHSPQPKQPETPGLISNVLSFVSREIESFVRTAAGGSSKEVRFVFMLLREFYLKILMIDTLV